MVNQPAARALIREVTGAARDPERARELVDQLLLAIDGAAPEEIRRAAIRVKQLAPRAPRVRELLGLAAFDSGRWHEAVQELVAYRRLKGDPRHDPTIAEAYRRDGRPEKALDLLSGLDRSVVPNDRWVEAQTTRARALVDVGQRGVAVSVLEALTIADPKSDAAAAAVRLLAELRSR